MPQETAAKTTTRDKPQDIADRLVSEHGLDAALKMVTDATLKASEEREYYVLSIWREVKAILYKKVGLHNKAGGDR